MEPADIDELGHMNVRVYARYAAAAVHELMAAAGLDAHALAALNARLLLPDCHTLFRREQVLGAPLGVRGALLDAEQSCAHAYLELFNRDSGELAATFRKEVRLTACADGSPLPLPDAVVEQARGLIVDWPAHGRPRSLPLDPVRSDLSLTDVVGQGITPRFGGYEVTPEMSTAEGFMDLSAAPWLAYNYQPVERVETEVEDDIWFADGDISIATLEARHSLVAVPRTGETVVTCSAITDVGRKVVRYCHWSFARQSGRLLAVLREVGIGLNLKTRRSCEFSPAMRAGLESRSHPELV